MAKITKDNTIVGLGRCCADEYWQIGRAAKRFDSVKYSVRNIGIAVGGSVTRMLACLQKGGFNTFFIGQASDNSELNEVIDSGLLQFGINHQLIITRHTMRSIIVLDMDGKLVSIYSQEEEADDRLPVETTRRIIKKIRPKGLIIDARHISAAIAAAEAGNSWDQITVLDPGSTVGEIFQTDDEENDVNNLVSVSTVIVASSSFYCQVSHSDSMDKALEMILSKGPLLLVMTLPDGRCRFATHSFDFVMAPYDVVMRGNSMGVGDMFRGWFLSHLLSRLRGRRDFTDLKREDVYRAGLFGLAAAALRKTDGTVIPQVSTRTEIKSFLTEQGKK